MSDRNASKSPGGSVTQAERSTGSGRKRPGSGWCIGRAHWPAALSSEQSSGSPYKESRARGSRCPPLVCARIRACGEVGTFATARACHKRPLPVRRAAELPPVKGMVAWMRTSSSDRTGDVTEGNRMRRRFNPCATRRRCGVGRLAGTVDDGTPQPPALDTLDQRRGDDSHARALTESRSFFAALNAGVCEAAMAMLSPVWGFVPRRAGRARVLNVPNPATATVSSLASASAMTANAAETTASAVA